MGKGHPDRNLEKHLAELSNHPALLRRCQEFYLERIINKLSYEELGRRKGVSLQTAWQYVQAYKKIAEKHKDDPTIQDTVAFCHNEIARLLNLREGASRQEYKLLTSEVRAYQAMINEVTGLIDRKTQVNVIQVNQVVKEAIGIIDTALRQAMQEAGLDGERIGGILARTSERLSIGMPPEN